MALGGGTFIAQNKVLAGAYINFVSVAKASANLGERGIAAIGLDLDWGNDTDIIEVTNEDFQKETMKIFGYSYADDKMKGLRDLFRNVTKLYVYRLNKTTVKASCTYANAKFGGTRGNDLKIVIQANVDDSSKFDVFTYLGTTQIDAQTVADATELVNNDFVDFITTATLQVEAGVALTGGTNGTVDSSSHQTFLDKIETYSSINALGCLADNSAIKNLYVAFTKRMRDEVGSKFQLVIHGVAADYEGVVNVKNTVSDGDASDLVYWVLGVIAGTAVNASCTNKVYDGEFTVNTNYKQSELIAAIEAGEFVLHQVSETVRILEDINSLVTVTDVRGEDFKSNQTIRVLDQIATDIASLFVTKYLGIVPNDAAGRTSLWADIVKHHKTLQDIRAIENFSDADVSVSAGDNKKSVVVSDYVTVVNAMEKLYMTVFVQ